MTTPETDDHSEFEIPPGWMTYSDIIKLERLQSRRIPPCTYEDSFQPPEDSDGHPEDRCIIWLWNKRLATWPFPLPEPGRIRSMVLSDNYFLRIPDEVFQCANLERLIMDSNHVIEIPDAIASLQNLDVLYLDHNLVRDISPAIGELKQLRGLRITGGFIKSVPDEIGDLESLEQLELGDHLLEAPEALGRCRNLRLLDLSSNRLMDLPESISSLDKLEHLMLTGNYFAKLPACIGRLPKLRWLHAKHNPLLEIPWFALDMPSLRGICFSTRDLDKREVEKFQKACEERGKHFRNTGTLHRIDECREDTPFEYKNRNIYRMDEI